MNNYASYQAGNQLGNAVFGTLNKATQGYKEGQAKTHLDTLLEQADQNPEILPKLQQMIMQKYGDTPYGQRASQVLAQKAEQYKKNKVNEQYKQIGEHLAKNFPESRQNSVISAIFASPDIDPTTKAALIKATSGLAPHLEVQQQRLKQGHDLNKAKALLSVAKSNLKESATDFSNGSEERKMELRAKVKEATELLEMIAKDEKKEEFKEKKIEQEEQKPVFDIKNPEHQKIKKKLMNKYKNDISKVYEALSEIYQ